MTIKEIEKQVGITKANIRFYESEGLLAPGRSANNYRQYTQEEAEALKKIKCLRTLGISVLDIRMIMRGEKSLETLLEQRIQGIEKEREELEAIHSICRDLKEDHVSFENLNFASLDVKMRILNIRGRHMLGQDRQDGMNRLRKAAWTWILICAASMALIPLHVILRIEVPWTVVNLYALAVLLSPIPYYVISHMMGRSINDTRDLYVLGKSRTAAPEVCAWKGVERFHQICMASLVIIPLNQLLKIQWPGYLTVIWMVILAGSTIAVGLARNGQAGFRRKR